MTITAEMIHPQLRRKGSFIRKLLPYFKLSTFQWCNRIQKLAKGRHSKALGFEQINITRSDGSLLRLCIYSPKEKRSGVPGIVWMHGGGYAIGLPEQEEGYIRDFIHESNCIVVAPDYRLSTEEPYPAALEDCYAALLWLKENAENRGVRSDQLMIGGDSAGGGLTAALAIYARDRGEVAVAFQMPLYPMLDDRMITESSRNNDAPVWNTKSNETAWKLYLGELYATEEIPAYAAPARLTDYRGLPPAFTFVGSIDPFRDETVAYMERLKAAGIPAQYQVFEGCFHGFDVMDPKATPSLQARELLREHFIFALEHSSAPQSNRSPVCP